MKHRLRQMVLLVDNIDHAVRDLARLFDLGVCHGSRDLSPYGLPAKGPMSEEGRKVLSETGVENVVLAIGSDFLELCAPVRPGTSAEKFMKRRLGSGGFMIVVQSGNVDAVRDRCLSMGIRIPLDHVWPHYRDIHLHTKDVPGAILSFAENRPKNLVDGAWYPAGSAWESMPRSTAVRAIAGAEIQSDGDPNELAELWARVMDTKAQKAGSHSEIEIDNATLRFVQSTDGRGTGISGIALRTRSAMQLIDNARAAGFPVDGNSVLACGVWFHLVESQSDAVEA